MWQVVYRNKEIAYVSLLLLGNLSFKTETRVRTYLVFLVTSDVILLLICVPTDKGGSMVFKHCSDATYAGHWDFGNTVHGQGEGW
jgi:hypothetical protein